MIIASLVGHTSSNKNIYQYDPRHLDHLAKMVAGFTEEDHFDSAAVFSYLQLVCWRKYGEDSREFLLATGLLYFHRSSMSDEFRKAHEVKLRIITAFDLANFGRKQCVSHLQALLDA